MKQDDRKQVKIKQTETGRSMVEMLGVLAVAGVLSVGGVIGYRYAMDKYNANEILNEVRKRAITASQQRILGHTINLSEYGNNTIQGHAVTTADKYNGDTSFFALTVSGIEKDICDKVIKEKIPFAVEEKVGEVVVGDDTTCAKGNSNTITFAFANTLDGEATLPEPDPACDGVDCPEGSSCSKGICWCLSGYSTCSGECCSEGSICSAYGSGGYDGVCIFPNGCSSNLDCDPGYYCQVVGKTSSKCCFQSYQGNCVPLTDIAYEIKIDGLGTLYASGEAMGNISAQNWCRAHNKEMAELNAERLNCYTDKGVKFSKYGTGRCAAQDVDGTENAIMRDLSDASLAGKFPQFFWSKTGYYACEKYAIGPYTINLGCRGMVLKSEGGFATSIHAVCE